MPSLIAHRGFAGRFPENTVGGIRAAVAAGADMVEIDVVPTADGEIVVFHDDRLDAEEGSRGVTDGAGVVWETDWADVGEATVLDSGEAVPRLADVLDAIPADVGVNVELKNPGRDDLRFGAHLPADEVVERRAVWRPFVEQVVETLDDPGRVLFSSFAEGAIAAAREVAPEIPVGVLCSSSVADGIAIARRHDAEAIHPRYTAIRGTDYADGNVSTGDAEPAAADTPDVLAVAREEGRDVNVWTVTTWHQAHQLRDAGVDGIIADYPGLLDGW